jgi:PASTA domain
MTRLLAALVLAASLAACAQRPGTGPAQAPAPGPSAQPKTVVPQLATMSVGEVDKVLSKAQLVPILRYEPGVVTNAGTVVATEPAAGSMVSIGDVVTVIVAGKPGETLGEYVAAHRETYIGIGADANGVLVIGIHRRADLQRELGELNRLAKGTAFRVQSCAQSWVDLQRVQLDLARRDFVPGADQLSFATTIDPLACAVRLTIDLSDAEIAQLTAKYSGALVIQRGTASRA